jgi:ribosome-associated protein
LFERVMMASGTSNRQTKALAASVRDKVREAGFPKPRIEGEENGEWIIIDCGQAVVHVMQPAIRQYYHLEEIWGEKPVRLKLGAPKPMPAAASKPPAGQAESKSKSKPKSGKSSARAGTGASRPASAGAKGASSSSSSRPSRQPAAQRASSAPAAGKAAAPARSASPAKSTTKPAAKPAVKRSAKPAAKGAAPRKRPASSSASRARKSPGA